MRSSTRAFVCAAAIFACLPAMAQAKLTGKVTHQIGGSVGHLPETKSLAGATVLIGIVASVERGRAGRHTVWWWVPDMALTE